MSPIILLFIVIGYLLLLFLISVITGRKSQSNSAFFIGNRQSPWYIVAFGMIGASVSGISVVSVPGMVSHSAFSYMQMVLGFAIGYVVIAYLLLPLYYKLNLTSIYGYLNNRFGTTARHTGSWCFIVAKMVSSASKLFIAVVVLQTFILNHWNIPFEITVIFCVAVIWLYTQRGGIKTIIWTDALQTFLLLVAVIMILIQTIKLMNLSGVEALETIWQSPLSQTFEWNDWQSPQHFMKQFLSGIFIVIVMTGLDQDMMQKNLSCKTLKQSQANMLSYGIAFIPVNFILLSLGVLFMTHAQESGIALPSAPDQMMPYYVQSLLGPAVSICFIIAILAASFSSTDSALTAITTSIMVDLMPAKWHNTTSKRLRQITHLGVCVVFIGLVLLFQSIPNKSILETIYTIVGYAYGPLLGLFTFGLFTRKETYGTAIPFIAIASPLFCYALQKCAKQYWGYSFGYELLMINGFITFAALYIGTYFVKREDV